MIKNITLTGLAIFISVFGICQNIVVEKTLFHDDFSIGNENWIIEQTDDGQTNIGNGYLEIDGGGCTAWFKEILNGPVMIEYDAILIQKGGLNDNCRDLNCFFMARHPRAPYDLFEGWRSNSKTRAGNFKEYHELRTYYAGIGGHKNTTTRFRRYTGHGDRPLLKEHDYTKPDFTLVPNETYKIQIITNNNSIQFFINGNLIFNLDDPQPYTSGWFGFRTVANHVKFSNFKVFRIKPIGLDKDKLYSTAEDLKLNKSLTELSFRKGFRNLQEFKRGQSYLSEKLVFYDNDTQGLIWRMTSDPSIETNEYTDIPVWSADGRLMLFISARNGVNERWLMDADGSNLRPLNCELNIPGDKGVWSDKFPDILYYAEKEYKGDKIIATKVIAANVESGKQKVVVRVERDLGKMMPPHPSEELFLFGDNMGGEWTDKEHPSRAFVVDRKGKVYEINFDKLYHRLRFNKSPEGRIFYNFDKPRTSFTCLPDGSDIREIKVNGGHPDWMEGGEWVIFNAREVLPDGTKNFDLRYDAIRYDGTGLKVVYPYGGHASTVADGLHIVCDGGPGAGSVNFVKIDSSNTCQNLFLNHTSRYDHSNNWHPNHHSTHPHPNSSPDGTKVMSNSDVFGEYSDIFVSIARFPEPPKNLSCETKGKSTKLTWQKAELSRETKGYNIYFTENSGKDYQKINEEPTPATNYTLPANYKGYFVVTAEEFSGLQSRPSNEAYYKGNFNWQGLARISFEAESGTCVLPFEAKMQMKTASNGYIVKSNEARENGKIRFQVQVPLDGTYAFWALTKGGGSIEVSADGKFCGTLSGVKEEWIWQKLQSNISFKQGKILLEVTGKTGSEELDKFYLTNDMSFQPKGLMKLIESEPDAPSNLKAIGLSANSIKINWNKVKNTSYYNVYAARDSNFKCTQNHLIGSPTENEFIDWGIGLNTRYHYSIKAVDFFGNESECSATVSASPEFFIPTNFMKVITDAESKNMLRKYDSQLGKDVLISDSVDSFVEIDFEIPKSGEYFIWGQSVIEPNQKLTYSVKIDELETEWKVFGLYNTWKWSPIGTKTSGSAEKFNLEAGTHKLTISSTEVGSLIGDVIITNNPEFYPVSEMKSTGY